MKFPFQFRRIPLEVSVLVVVVAVVVGFAAYQLFDIVRVVGAGPAKFKETQNVFKLHEVLKLQKSYFAIGEDLQRAIEKLHLEFRAFAVTNDRAALGRFQSQSQELKNWIAKQRSRLELERLERSSTNRPAWITPDEAFLQKVDLALQEVDLVYSKYLADAKIVTNSIWQPMMKELVRKNVEDAESQKKKLVQLAGKVRDAGENIDIKLVLPEHTAWFHRLQDRLQTLLYVVGIAFVLLCVLLLISLYRLLVVNPLTTRLIESNAILEQQKKLAHFGYLAAILAHEIRNPLTAINARLYTLKKALGSGSAEQKDAVVIGNEIARLDRIVNEFLKLARSTEPKLVRMTAEPALKEVRDLLAPQFERQSIELKLDSSVPSPFQADPQQLKQVLINLIKNAAESIGHDGTITLRARNGNVPLKGNTTDVVMLEVEDTGPGMSPEVQQRLFDPFYSTKENGTGLGLPIAVQIIDKHGGALELETAVGRGTIFSIVLPICKPTG